MTTTNEPNVAELDALLAWAEAEHAKQVQGKPSEWDQGHWAVDVARYNRYFGYTHPVPAVNCGTACCLAGKAVARQGGLFLLGDAPEGVTSQAEMPNGEVVDVETYAQDFLGLTDGQAVLFDGDNTIEDVRRIIAAIKEGDLFPTTHDEFQESTELENAYDAEDAFF